ncbi:chromatin target of PRMT1 isoform X1 [Brachionus plicatilis]|uniref:Chromatin target of PRMT1 isoform X1 n=1 Tax=Brachionus plicatilis TaxID=10195 RepID=A0A3M7RMU8_BRAPC|nr:chromatin target of PRMT1 isoform X1 [Brachionus plicatilis]
MLNQKKMTLSASTKLSLHDRFTKLAMLKPTTSSNGKNDRALNLIRQKASAKNRRLAIQMANRPSVQAALKLKQRSIKQGLSSGKFRENKPIFKIQTQANKSRLGPKTQIDPTRLSRKHLENRNGLKFYDNTRSHQQLNQRLRNNDSKLENKNDGLKRPKINANIRKREPPKHSNFKTRIIRNKKY